MDPFICFSGVCGFVFISIPQYHADMADYSEALQTQNVFFIDVYIEEM